MLLALERAALLGTRALSVVGLAALMLLAGMTLADGVGRSLFNAPIEGVRDIGGPAIAVAIVCCLPMGLLERGNVTIRLIENMSAAAGRVFNVLAAVLVEVTLLAMAWQFYLYAEKLARGRETTWVLQIPVAPFWFGVDVIIWCAALVQAIVVLMEAARLGGQVAAHHASGASEVPTEQANGSA